MNAKEFLTGFFLQARKKRKKYPVVADLKGKRLGISRIEANDEAKKVIIYLEG